MGLEVKGPYRPNHSHPCPTSRDAHPPSPLTVAGKSEWLLYAVTQHGHLQVDLIPEVLWARGDSTPDIASQGVVLDVRARSKAVQEEREKDPRCAFRREQSRRRLLGPSHPEAKGPSVPAQAGPPGL